MRTWNKLIKYRITIFLLSSKFIVPMMIYLVFTYTTYKQKPQSFVSDITVSAIMLGYVMLWISFAFFENEDIVAERILYCNIQQNKVSYYGSKIITLILISVILSFIGVAYPFIVNCLNGFDLFDISVTCADFCYSLLLHMVVSYVFIAVSYLLQPRIISNRKMAILLTILICVVSISESGVISNCEIMKYILWIFPPVSVIADCFYGLDYFTIHSILVATLYSLIYSMVVLTIGIIVVDKKDF